VGLLDALGSGIRQAWEWVGDNPETVERVAKGGVDLYRAKRQRDQIKRASGGKASGPVIVPTAGGWQGPLRPGQVYSPSGSGPLTQVQAGIGGELLDLAVGGAIDYGVGQAVDLAKSYLPEWMGGYNEMGEQGEIFEGGGQSMAITSALQRRSPIPGGVALGQGQGMFHTTPSGYRMPNRITLVKDADSNKLGFFVDAGTPKTWSKISFKKHRHHHHPR
jgi:hypothetical protein